MSLSTYSPRPLKLHKGGRTRGSGGKAQSRCRICGRPIHGRNGGMCPNCLSDSMGGGGTACGSACGSVCAPIDEKLIGKAAGEAGTPWDEEVEPCNRD